MDSNPPVSNSNRTNNIYFEKKLIAEVRAALIEDIGDGDKTAVLIPENKFVVGQILSRGSATLAGAPWATSVFAQLSKNITVNWLKRDGEKIRKDTVIATLEGPAREILTGERIALNFLQTMSAIATVTNKFVQKTREYRTIILDTRKTIPGLRHASKYAVKIGGGHNHRMGLYDGILIKENHIRSAGGIKKAIKKALCASNLPIQIEVETAAEMLTAIENGARLILLDNFSTSELIKCVKLNNRKAIIEASGGITLSNIEEIARTGVDRISVGAITKNINAIDLSFQLSIN